MQSEQPNSTLPLQLESIYSTLQYNNNKDDNNSTLNSPTFDSLDYGQKLVANHNILKDLIMIVDSKIAARQSKKSQVSSPSVRQPDKKGTFDLDNRNEKKDAVLGQKHAGQSRLQEKLMVVRQKLKEIISFINEEAKGQTKPSKTNINLQEIKEISSQYEPSLQYSQDQSQLLEISKEKFITIDKSKLDHAKEVVSHEFLGPDKNHLSNRHYTEPMKSSLQKISEAQNSENTTEKDIDLGVRSKGHSRMNSKATTAKHSLKLVEEQQLDETGKIILSTINKKTTSTRTLLNNKSNIGGSGPPEDEVIREATSAQETESVGSSIKNYRFWLKTHKNPIQNYSGNTLVSHEILDDSKLKASSRSNLKITSNSFRSQQQIRNAKRSPDKLPQTTNPRSPPKPAPLNNTPIQIQSSQMIPITPAYKNHLPHQSYIIYDNPSQTSEGGPSMPRHSNAKLRQSQVVREFQQQIHQPRPTSNTVQHKVGEAIGVYSVHSNPDPRVYIVPNRLQEPQPIRLDRQGRDPFMGNMINRSQSPPPRAYSPSDVRFMNREHPRIHQKISAPNNYAPIPQPMVRPATSIPLSPPHNFIQIRQMPAGMNHIEEQRQQQMGVMPPRPPKAVSTAADSRQRVMHRYKPSLEQIVETSEHSLANSMYREPTVSPRAGGLDPRFNRSVVSSQGSRSASKKKGIHLTTAYPA